jgi:hypothetical protein
MRPFEKIKFFQGYPIWEGHTWDGGRDTFGRGDQMITCLDSRKIENFLYFYVIKNFLTSRANHNGTPYDFFRPADL